ncbi:ADP-ribose pyrophosphatase, mitochondrial [Leptinotarsa decemlineata]|uniref:ADP-ribose pyrophosphatase, mitochondrial n=1 Tax=Leptinotarsa decemlineata TaxID=7539 RepID=UPI003D30A128
MILIRMVHSKCRNGTYPFTELKRVVVTEDLVSWNANWNGYDPPEYNSEVLLNKPWADPPLYDPKFEPKWNELDGVINRKSFMGIYNIVDGRPQNPEGRTGIKGRGILGKWGPNHAADPIVTRWKMVNGEKEINTVTKLPILQLCCIQRRDCGQWALPGGMVDPGEKVTETLQREFLEEVLDSMNASSFQKQQDCEMIKSFFTAGTKIYEGYVDDPRNTDNSWMETVAVNFHDENGLQVGKFDLKAGDDAQNVQWMDVDENLNLYANHSQFVKTVVQLLNAHW